MRLFKGEEDFANLGRGRACLPAQKAKKFFAPLFFKKAATYLTLTSAKPNAFNLSCINV
jgi:hypothetical protein